jgi:hypothetical protein
VSSCGIEFINMDGNIHEYLNLVGLSMDGRMLNSFDVRVIMWDRVLKIWMKISLSST